MHRAVLAALLAVALLPATAGAAPRACTDPAGDVRLTRGGPLVEAPHLDLRSWDVASNRRVTTVVIRLTDLTEDGEGVWSATWRLGRTSYWAQLSHDSTNGTRAGAGVVSGAAIAAMGHLDYLKNEVRIHLLRGMSGRLGSFALNARRAGDTTTPVVVDDFAC